MSTVAQDRKFSPTDVGPIQLKRVNKAISALQWRCKTRVRIAGVKGVNEFRSELTSMFGEVRPEFSEIVNRIGEQYGWIVSKANAKEIEMELEAATNSLVLPEDDERTEPEAHRVALEEQRKRELERAEQDRIAKESHTAILAKKPAWAEALIVAEEEVNESDITTDYFNSRVVRRVAIGWRKGKREDFAQLRKAAATFPETAHLSPGKDGWRVRMFDEPLTSEHAYRKSHITNDCFDTQADAEKHVVEANYINGTEVVLYEKYEHRENYSMGGGNYLKAGGRHGSGWKVSSISPTSLYGVIEDHLPN